MHDPYAVHDRQARIAPRPSVHRIRRWTSVGLVLALAGIALALLGLCWAIVSATVHWIYAGFGGAKVGDHMFDGGRRVLLVLVTALRP